MFDISFSELMLIGVIALIVIGPERLPKVARTVGHLLGRAQRYVNDVKTDIRKEMDSSEISTLKDQMQEAASSVKASVDEAGKAWRAPLDEAQDALKQASDSVKTLADAARNIHDPANATPGDATPGDTSPDASSSPVTEPAGSGASDPVQRPTSDQDMEESESIDTQTLPLPGFEREREPVMQDSAGAESSNANKGPQP